MNNSRISYVDAKRNDLVHVNARRFFIKRYSRVFWIRLSCWIAENSAIESYPSTFPAFDTSCPQFQPTFVAIHHTTFFISTTSENNIIWGTLVYHRGSMCFIIRVWSYLMCIPYTLWNRKFDPISHPHSIKNERVDVERDPNCQNVPSQLSERPITTVQ